MERLDIYQSLADRLDSFPQGYPSTEDGKELALLAYLFTPDEAQLATFLSLDYEPLAEVADQAGFSFLEGQSLVRSMLSKGLISVRRGKSGLEVKLFPFIVGFYENQRSRMDETFARLFEAYYHDIAQHILSITPQFHRVIPINASIEHGIEILPDQNVVEILSSKKAWAVFDCVCRKQKALIGDGCDHPIRTCMAISDVPGVFDHSEDMDALDLEGALHVLDQAAQAGLVHTVSNMKKEIGYICNCCTCSCGLLRGIAEANIANVVARSAYFAHVDDSLCTGCGNCVSMCQFGAITITDFAEIHPGVCAGCGLCTRVCPEEAISLRMRDRDEILETPESEDTWLLKRAQARGISGK